MAASKINKIKRIGEPKHTPRTPYVTNIKNPDTFNSSLPSWCFRLCDRECWTLTAGDLNEILPKLKDWEAQTWNEILVKANKQNHSIDAANLNKLARERLDTMRIEAEAIVSLRLQGTHRLYGYRIGSVFYILWYDKDHGDNDTCVCRSHKKGT